MIRNLFRKIWQRLTRRQRKQKLKYLFRHYRDKPRFVPTVVPWEGSQLIVPDAPSFAYQIKDVFIDEEYRFFTHSLTHSPLIYDCGANIGISVLYFKSLYPNATIKAFEADAAVFDVLKKNVAAFTNLHLFLNAVWTDATTLNFHSEGADGGSLVCKPTHHNGEQTVQAIRLKDMLHQESKVDFLKMDIEGAETAVIEDCQDELHKIAHLFIEYHSLTSAPQSLDRILAVLTKTGFRYYLQSLGEKKTPFINRESDQAMDLQVNIFGYREAPSCLVEN